MPASKNWTSSMPMTSTSCEAAGFEELGFEAVGCWGDDCGVVGLRAVAGDGGAVVAEVDVGFEAGYALAGDAGALEAADELFGFAGEHGADDDFDSARGCGIVMRQW